MPPRTQLPPRRVFKPRPNPYRDAHRAREAEKVLGRLPARLGDLSRFLQGKAPATVAALESLDDVLHDRDPETRPGFIVSTEPTAGPQAIHLTDMLTGEPCRGRIALYLDSDPQDMYCGIPGTITIQRGYDFRVQLPDGTLIQTDEHGIATVIDGKLPPVVAPTRYGPPVEFNRYINASDLLAEFIEFVAQRGVVQEDIQKVPVGLFINWLIAKAAETDGEPVPDDLPLTLPEPPDAG